MTGPAIPMLSVPMAIMIRPLGTADFPLIASLARRIWPVAYAGILSAEQLENLLTRIYGAENLAAERAEGHRFWGAFEEERELGYASGYRQEDVIWIKKLYVLPEAQGKGVGLALMQSVIAGFSPAKEVRLFVNGDNRRAQDFYRRCGFINAGAVPVKMGDFSFTDFVFVKVL